MHYIVMEITKLIVENHGKFMKLCFEFLWEPCIVLTAASNLVLHCWKINQTLGLYYLG